MENDFLQLYFKTIHIINYNIYICMETEACKTKPQSIIFITLIDNILEEKNTFSQSGYIGNWDASFIQWLATTEKKLHAIPIIGIFVKNS